MRRMLILLLPALFLLSCTNSEYETSDDYINKYDEEELEEYVRYYSDDFIHVDDIDDYIDNYRDDYIHKDNIEDYITNYRDEYIHKDDVETYVIENMLDEFILVEEMDTYIEECTDYILTNSTQETELINIFRTLSETEKAKALLYIAELGKE